MQLYFLHSDFDKNGTIRSVSIFKKEMVTNSEEQRVKHFLLILTKPNWTWRAQFGSDLWISNRNLQKQSYITKTWPQLVYHKICRYFFRCRLNYFSPSHCAFFIVMSVQQLDLKRFFLDKMETFRPKKQRISSLPVSLIENNK